MGEREGGSQLDLWTSCHVDIQTTVWTTGLALGLTVLAFALLWGRWWEHGAGPDRSESFCINGPLAAGPAGWPRHVDAAATSLFLSGRGDLNSRPLDPQSSALTKLRHGPMRRF
jgi:hypothetical protein